MEKLITIVGGGLAGLSLGIALRRAGVPVVLHEAGCYPRHRVCGEYISGVTPRTLRTLDIEDIFAPAVRQRFTAWFRHDRLIARHELPEEAIGLSRRFLDDALAERFTALGGDLRERSRSSSEAAQTEGVVWAAGRRPARGGWIGLKEHFRNCPLAADLEMHLGDGAYVGLARVEDGAVNVCGLFPLLPDRPSGPMLTTYLERCGLGSLAGRLRSAEAVSASPAAITGFALGWQDGAADGELCLGDARAMIPPFTGNGMTMAFQSAEEAVGPLAGFSLGGTSWHDTVRSVRRRLDRRFRRRMFFAARLHPFLTSAPRQALFACAAGRRLLPFRLCYYLLR